MSASPAKTALPAEESTQGRGPWFCLAAGVVLVMTGVWGPLVTVVLSMQRAFAWIEESPAPTPQDLQQAVPDSRLATIVGALVGLALIVAAVVSLERRRAIHAQAAR